MAPAWVVFLIVAAYAAGMAGENPNSNTTVKSVIALVIATAAYRLYPQGAVNIVFFVVLAMCASSLHARLRR